MSDYVYMHRMNMEQGYINTTAVGVNAAFVPVYFVHPWLALLSLVFLIFAAAIELRRFLRLRRDEALLIRARDAANAIFNPIPV